MPKTRTPVAERQRESEATRPALRWPSRITGRIVRHEALFVRMEVKDRPSPCRRSGGVKLEAARSAGRRKGWEQPRQSRVVPVLPDGAGAVSETGRYTRETGCVTPLDRLPALTRWMWAGSRRVPVPLPRGGELQAGSYPLGSGGHGEGLRRSRWRCRRGRVGCLTR